MTKEGQQPSTTSVAPSAALLRPASDVEGGCLGSAHALRNLGGKLAANLLNSSTRKDETRLRTNTGFRAVRGASLKA